MSKTPRTDEIIRAFVSGENEAACIICLRRDVEELETELEQAMAIIEQTRKAFKKILKIQRTIDMNLFDIEEIHSIAQAALSAIESEATDGK